MIWFQKNIKINWQKVQAAVKAPRCPIMANVGVSASAGVWVHSPGIWQTVLQHCFGQDLSLGLSFHSIAYLPFNKTSVTSNNQRSWGASLLPPKSSSGASLLTQKQRRKSRARLFSAQPPSPGRDKTTAPLLLREQGLQHGESRCWTSPQLCWESPACRASIQRPPLSAREFRMENASSPTSPNTVTSPVPNGWIPLWYPRSTCGLQGMLLLDKPCLRFLFSPSTRWSILLAASTAATGDGSWLRAEPLLEAFAEAAGAWSSTRSAANWREQQTPDSSARSQAFLPALWTDGEEQLVLIF